MKKWTINTIGDAAIYTLVIGAILYICYFTVSTTKDVYLENVRINDRYYERVLVPQDIALDYLAIAADVVAGAVYTYDMIHFIRKLKRNKETAVLTNRLRQLKKVERHICLRLDQSYTQEWYGMLYYFFLSAIRRRISASSFGCVIMTSWPTAMVCTFHPSLRALVAKGSNHDERGPRVQ
jgi:hypothetical protein